MNNRKAAFSAESYSRYFSKYGGDIKYPLYKRDKYKFINARFSWRGCYFSRINPRKNRVTVVPPETRAGLVSKEAYILKLKKMHL